MLPVRCPSRHGNACRAPRRRALALLAGVGLVGAGCGGAVSTPPAADAGAPFVEVAARVGLDFAHFNGMSGEFYMVENMAAGAGLLDYDGDGDLDAYLVQGALLGPGKTMADATFPWRDAAPPRDRLYRNELMQSGELRFTDVTAASGIDSPGYGIGVAVGDYDGDARPDIYVTRLGPNVLWRNRGDGTFEDVTAASGTGDPAWSSSAAFVDYDRDGWLDLFVADYLNYNFDIDKDCYGPLGQEDYCDPSSYLPVPDRLYRNRGDGTFEDVTAAAGIARAYGPGLGVIVADFDQDNWPDIYVANDGKPNILWINQRDGTFRDTALLAGCALNADGKAEASMGVDAADFDGDGDEDLFMSHLAGETNTIYVNDGRGVFEDRSVQTGLGPASRVYTGFGAAWFDYDNDGWLDILVVNGGVKTIEELARRGDPYPLHQRNQLFRNVGNARYEEVTERAGPAFELSEVTRGAAFGDVDNDGDVDVLLGNNAGPARLLLNQVGSRNHWIGLRVAAGEPPRDLPGTRVEVRTGSGRTLWRRSRTDGSYGSANDPRVVVGLGNEGGTVRVTVRWPDGSAESWSDLAVDRWVTLRRGEGTPESGP